jgi:hypothetical protein
VKDGLLARLAAQLEPALALAASVPEIALAWHPPGGQWSALENLAHLARHHEVMIERLQRMLAEDAPVFQRYRAEEDADWGRWQGTQRGALLPALVGLRRRLIDLVAPFDATALARVGVHARFGRMSVAEWLDFFLVHEAHHLYVVRLRLAEARLALA